AADRGGHRGPQGPGWAQPRAAQGVGAGLLRGPDPIRDRRAAGRAPRHREDPHTHGDDAAPRGPRTAAVMSDDRFLELAPLAALGALDSRESADFEAHARDSLVCRAELEVHQRLAALIPQ